MQGPWRRSQSNKRVSEKLRNTNYTIHELMFFRLLFKIRFLCKSASFEIPLLRRGQNGNRFSSVFTVQKITSLPHWDRDSLSRASACTSLTEDKAMGIPHTCACMHACSVHPSDWGQEVSRAHPLVMLHLAFVSLSILSFNQRFEETSVCH